MTQPINQMFKFFTQKCRVQVWLYDIINLRIEGRIMGFDEFMNIVLDDAEEIKVKEKTRETVGRIMLKGDNISLITEAR